MSAPVANVRSTLRIRTQTEHAERRRRLWERGHFVDATSRCRIHSGWFKMGTTAPGFVDFKCKLHVGTRVYRNSVLTNVPDLGCCECGCRVNSCIRDCSRAKDIEPAEHRKEASFEETNGDIRVRKYVCSRCALNVSFWGILWHSMSDLGARKLLITQVSP
jgi:hypothetical protein